MITVCNSGAFKCPGEKKCIYSSSVCDGYSNCENAADEINCSKKKIKHRVIFNSVNRV